MMKTVCMFKYIFIVKLKLQKIKKYIILKNVILEGSEVMAACCLRYCEDVPQDIWN